MGMDTVDTIHAGVGGLPTKHSIHVEGPQMMDTVDSIHAGGLPTKHSIPVEGQWKANMTMHRTIRSTTPEIHVEGRGMTNTMIGAVMLTHTTMKEREDELAVAIRMVA